MEEIFESEAFILREDEELCCPVLTWKGNGGRDDYRTPLMHAADMAKLIKSDTLIIDRWAAPEVPEADRKWLVKTLIPYMKKAGIERIIVVVPADQVDAGNSEYPLREIAENFRIEKRPSYEASKQGLLKERQGLASREILAMTREEALGFLGLEPGANDFAIDEKFWQLSKRYRGEKDEEAEQKLADIEAAYDIATGKRDEREQALRIRDSKKKFFGKTSDEWRNYFYYTWYKYLIGIIIAIICGNLVYNMFFKPKVDCGIVSIGHFQMEGDYYEGMLANMGYRNPYLTSVDYVVPNDQEQSMEAYASQAAQTIFLSYPNVIVSDINTVKYFSGQYADISNLYYTLRSELPPDIYNKLTPVYTSEIEYQELMKYSAQYYGITETDEEDEEYSDEKIMIGIEITDEAFIRRLGYINMWPETDPTLVFCINNQSMDISDSELIITQIFKEMG